MLAKERKGISRWGGERRKGRTRRLVLCLVNDGAELIGETNAGGFGVARLGRCGEVVEGGGLGIGAEDASVAPKVGREALGNIVCEKDESVGNEGREAGETHRVQKDPQEVHVPV